jgi:hypothetical protein
MGRRIATSVADFGAPSTTDRTFCIYDQSPRPQPVIADSADNPGDWTAMRDGFAYIVRDEHPLRTARLPTVHLEGVEPPTYRFEERLRRKSKTVI